MKIYFCDKCHESIPLKDIKSNRITIDAGKIYCQGCAPKPARLKPSFSVASLGLIMVGCVAVGMVVMALWGDAILGIGGGDDGPDSLASVEKNLRARMDRLEKELETVRSDMEESPDVDGKSGKLARVHQAIKNNAGAMTEIRDGFNALRDEIKSKDEGRQRAEEAFRMEIRKELERHVDGQVKIEGDVDKLHAKIDGIQEEVKLLGDKIGSVSNAVVTQGDTVTKKTAGDDGPKLDAKQEEKLTNALALLKDKEAPKRFQAVFDVAEFRGVKRAEEALVTALDDEMDYVQTAALNNLAEMSAKWTIPNIIQKLTDKNAFVVEAAIDALSRLTGRPVEIDPNSSSLKILGKVRELEKWWAENKDEILAKK